MRRLLHPGRKNAANRSAATRNLPETMSQADTLYNEARQQNTLSAADAVSGLTCFLPRSWMIGSWRSITGDLHRSSVIYYLRDRAGYRGEKARLQHYLIENKPLFTRTHKRKVGSICYLNTAPTPSGVGELYGAVCR